MKKVVQLCHRRRLTELATEMGQWRSGNEFLEANKPTGRENLENFPFSEN